MATALHHAPRSALLPLRSHLSQVAFICQRNLCVRLEYSFFFFFNDTAPTEIYPLPLPAALPICAGTDVANDERVVAARDLPGLEQLRRVHRSEEHTSELQSRSDLVCRLLLE